MLFDHVSQYFETILCWLFFETLSLGYFASMIASWHKSGYQQGKMFIAESDSHCCYLTTLINHQNFEMKIFSR